MRARSAGRSNAAWYALIATVALIAVALDYDLGVADLRAPLADLYGGDATYFAGAHFKATVEQGAYLENALLGAPGVLDLRDFPAPDLVYFAAIATGGVFTARWELVLNLYTILSFPLAAITAAWAMRRFGVGWIGAATGSLLFAFLPFHHFRLFGHPHLALTIYVVPLGAVLALAVLRGEEVFFATKAAPSRLPRFLRSRATFAMTGYALFVGLTGHVYYTFFALAVLSMAGIVTAVRSRSTLPLLRAGAMVGVSLSAFLLQILPFWVHARTNGTIPFAQRDPGESEIYGLKIAQLVLPQSNHRFEILSTFKQGYDASAPLVNENTSSYLGIIGVAGFAVLVVVLFTHARRARDDRRSLLPDLAVLNMSALLLGTVGGVGSLIAFAGLPAIRSYNRVSVLIGFYCLFAVAVLVDQLVAKATTGRRRAGAAALASALTLFGIHETSYAGAPDYAAQNVRWAADAAFVAELERALPEGAAVFQLPHMTFPEAPHIQNLIDYAPMQPYLHSKHLRWSYGAMRGRRIDAWSSETAALGAEHMVEALTLAGFSAVWVMRDGFEDRAAETEADLARVLGPPLLVSPSGSAAVFSLRAYADALRAKLSGPDDWEARRDAARSLYLGFYDGFHPVDSSRIGSGRRGRFLVENPSSRSRRATLRMTVRGVTGPTTLRIRGSLLEGDFAIDHEPTVILRTLDVPPGKHWLVADCDGAAWSEIFAGHRVLVVFDEARLYGSIAAPD